MSKSNNHLWDASGKGESRRFVLKGTKFRVVHCGHPTAIWPWYGITPENLLILAPNGKAFSNSADCKQAVLAAAQRAGVSINV